MVRWPWVLGILPVAAAMLLTAGLQSAYGEEESKGSEVMKYGQVREYLARHTKILELVNEEGARVLICPEWQARVMTSSCDGLQGLSFGFVNKAFIDEGKPNPHFANYGGEDRFWLSPEGGPFSLWFKQGVEQILDNWFTPPALNEGAWPVISRPQDPFYRMHRKMEVVNASGTQFQLEVTRDIRLLNEFDLQKHLGDEVAEMIQGQKVKSVAYETINRMVNVGEPMQKEKGLVSIWILGMFNAGPETVIIVPYRQGDEATLGPVVKTDYFGEIPPERLKILPEAVLFLGDGKYRSKIGTSQKRAKNIAGSMDYQNNVLTLVQFTMPDDPTQHLYLNNMWKVPQEQPYVGDVFNSYNDGPVAPGKPGLGPFYEIESLSPAVELKTGEKLEHAQRTLHIQGDYGTLKTIAQKVLGVDLDVVKKTMLGK